MMKSFIHLSDLHFRLNWHEDQGVVLSAFFKDLEKQIKSLNGEDVFLVFSGDIVQAGGDSKLYEEFMAVFDSELNKLNIPKTQRICVPGNHDISVDFLKENSVEHEGVVSQKLKDWEFNNYISRQPNLIISKFINYRIFEAQFAHYGIGNDTISGAGWNITDDLAVYCLNTALLSCGGFNGIDDQNRLSIDTRSLFKWVQECNAKTKVLVMHHPIDWLVEWAKPELLNIIKKNFALCLSGHVHDQSYFYSINKDSNLLNCSAPPLLTNKKDNLGYAIISVSEQGVHEIYYRQWTKNNSFVTGVNFSDSDDGKVVILTGEEVGQNVDGNGPVNQESHSSKTNGDFVSRYLTNALSEALRSFSSQPIVWVDPTLSKSKENARDRRDIISDQTIDVSIIINEPTSIIIQAPPQFGLTCLAHYMIKESWLRNQKLWIYLDFKTVQWHSIEKAVNKELLLFGLDASSINCIVLDSWVNNEKDSAKFINKLSELYKDKPLIILQSIDDSQFLEEPNTESLNRKFGHLHLLALPRGHIRKVVSDYNNERHIGEEDAVISKVVSDLEVLNIHRTPLNCLTLLKVSEKYFDESPINRAEMIKMVLFLLFNMESVPTYKSKPDLKDCEYVLGSFCEKLIRSKSYTYTRDNFIRELTTFCAKRVIYLEVEVVFDVLYSNNIIIKRGSEYCFRFSYWIYYFAAHRMQQDQVFAKFILEDRKYASFPEIIEFYTGIDRSRKDALDIIINDLRVTCDIVSEKVGLPEAMNHFSGIKWNPSEQSIEKMKHQISDDVMNSKLPDSIKDKFADQAYDQIKPYNQSVQHIFIEYSLGTLMQCMKAASRALRNSDYVDPDTKRELLTEIMRCWNQISKVLLAIVPVLAAKSNATVDGLAVMLLGNFGDTPEQRMQSILMALPYNVMDWFRSDLYSEKMGPLLFDKMESEDNELVKHELILLLAHERPREWSTKIKNYIISLSKNSFYLFDIYTSLRTQYEYAYVTPKTLREIEYLIKMCVAKHKLGAKSPGIQAINKIPDKVLPKRDSREDK